MNNFFEIKILAKLENISLVRVAISSFISNVNISVEDLMDVKTAVSEAVTNAIEHGYKEYDEKNIVNTKAYINDENVLSIEVEDFGIGIDDIELALTPTYTSKPELEHAGLGFTIMENFMDEVIVDSKIECGTKISMKKELKSHKSLK